MNRRLVVVAWVVAPLVGLGACKSRPAPDAGKPPAGWFAFRPGPDPFAPSPIDLRWMNEARAGDGGFITTKGPNFIHEKTGEPVRFWAVNARPSVVLEYDQAGFERLARFLAKLGVNMVRFHGPLWRSDDVTQIDAAKLNKIHALVAALKQQGIYLELSTYFPVGMHPADGGVFEGYEGTQSPFALSFFNEKFQAMQKNWWRAMLTAPNPYTGLPLARDPALAFFEVINEDSLFFWTFAPYKLIPAPQMKIIETLFGDWLRARYGSLPQAFARWGGGRAAGDDETAGRAGLQPWAETLRRRDARAKDTVTFLTTLQRRYFDEMFRFLKDELGFKGSVTGSNWITADARTLGPLDKWSNAGGDFLDRHGYFSGPHEGKRATYMISDGDSYDDALALRFETAAAGGAAFDLPIMDLSYNDKPSTTSEIGWVPPNRYRTDLPILAAAYGALQGTDAFFFFIGGENAWVDHIEKFTITDPVAMGQFPATALMYRQGLVRAGEAVVHLESDLPSLWAFRGLSVAAPHNLDPLRAQGVPPADRPAAPAADGSAGAVVDPLAFLVGRVEVNVAKEASGTSRVTDLSSYIDRSSKRVRSVTGELLWDWGRGVVTVDAPGAQGATGLLQGAGPIALRDITILAGTEYSSVLLVAMDGAPLSTSRRMLLQVMSEDVNSGWSAPGRGLRSIASVGGPPILVKMIAGTVTFKRGDASSFDVRPLDFNGYPTEKRVAINARREIALLPDVFYYYIVKS